jgi:hypothetical protein
MAACRHRQPAACMRVIRVLEALAHFAGAEAVLAREVGHLALDHRACPITLLRFRPARGRAPEERWTRYPQRGKVRFP